MYMTMSKYELLTDTSVSSLREMVTTQIFNFFFTSYQFWANNVLDEIFI